MNHFDRLQASREANKQMKVYFLEVGTDNRAQLSCFGTYPEVLSLYNMAACLLVGYTQRMLDLDHSIKYEKKGEWSAEGLPNTYQASLRLAQTPDEPWADEVGHMVWCEHMVFFAAEVSGVRQSYRAMGQLNLRMGAGSVSYKLQRTTLLMSAHFVSLHRVMNRALTMAQQEGVSLPEGARLLAFTEKLKNAEAMLVLQDNEVSL